MNRTLLLASLLAAPAFGQVDGWLNWRGPLQAGVSTENALPDSVDPTKPLWTFEARGRGTPVIANGRVYSFFYTGEDKDLEEGIACLDEETGRLLWEDRWSDFVSDVVYDRYAIGAPSIDPETGEVYILSTAGILKCYSPEGMLHWEKSLTEDLGRLTFPNGRTGSPLIDEDRVIVHVITAHWGPTFGPAGDHWYAFDKTNGDFIWECRPGVGPIDSPYSHPVVGELDGQRLLYAGTGCGQVVCIDSRTGDAQWRFPLSGGGVCASPVLLDDRLIAINGKENLDDSTFGRMVAIKLGARPNSESGPVVLGKESELWRNGLTAFTSSLVRVGDRIYNTVATGELCATDLNTGEVLWQHKLGSDQIHASPCYGDGKLYVPMTNGSFHIVRPTDEGPELLQTVQLEGSCLGAPAIFNGRIYVHTTERLYVFGDGEWRGTRRAVAPLTVTGKPGKAVRLQVILSNTLLTVGDPLHVRVRSLDDKGLTVSEDLVDANFELPGVIQIPAGGGDLTATSPGVGAVTVRMGDLSGSARLRVVKPLGWAEDFEGFELNKQGADGLPSAFPPSYWTGVFKKWEVVDTGASKVLRKTLDMPLFQRAMGFNGHPDMSNYTVQIDGMSDGNRRTMGAIGVVNQRYLIALMGNLRMVEVSSNHERIKEQVPFRATPGVWYTIKSRVDIAEDGTGTIRGKVWPRDEPEPDAWTIEVTHANPHINGSPGIFGFTPQSRFHVYADNFQVTPND